MLRARKFRRSEVHDEAALFHQRDTISKQQSFAKIVGNKDDRFLHPLLQCAKFLLHLRSCDGIKRAESLVKNQDRRIRCESPRHSHALSLAPRELAWIARCQFLIQPDCGQQLSHARFDARLGPVFNSRHERDVALNGEVWEQTTVLNDIPDASPQPDRIPLRSATSVNAHVACGRQQQAVDQLQSGRLPRAASAQQHQGLPLLHGEHEILKQRTPVQTEGSMIKFDGRFGGGSISHFQKMERHALHNL